MTEDFILRVFLLSYSHCNKQARIVRDRLPLERGPRVPHANSISVQNRGNEPYSSDKKYPSSFVYPKEKQLPLKTANSELL